MEVQNIQTEQAIQKGCAQCGQQVQYPCTTAKEAEMCSSKQNKKKSKKKAKQ